MSRKKKELSETLKHIQLKKSKGSGTQSKLRSRMVSASSQKRLSILIKSSQSSTFKRNLENIFLELKEQGIALDVLASLIVENDKKMKAMQGMMSQFLMIFSTYNTALQAIAGGEKIEPEQEN